MQEQITFQLSKEFISESSQDISALKRELLLNLKSIEDLLVSYHFRTRGRVFDVSLNENSIELMGQRIGKFIVNYGIGQFNACADVDFTDRGSMEMLIDIDVENSKTIITGEYIPERDPDEF